MLTASQLAGLMSAVWVPANTVRKWVLPRRAVRESEVSERSCGHFQKKYDRVQGMILQIGCRDELLSGMSSSP